METFHLIRSLDFCAELGERPGRRVEPGRLGRGFAGLRQDGLRRGGGGGRGAVGGEAAALCLSPVVGGHCSAGRSRSWWAVGHRSSAPGMETVKRPSTI